MISTYRCNHCQAKIGRQQIHFFVIPAKCLLEWKSTPAQYCSSNSGITAESQIHFSSLRDGSKACNGNSGINKVTSDKKIGQLDMRTLNIEVEEKNGIYKS